MWSIDRVVNALANQNYPDLSSEKELALELFDEEKLCGIGTDNMGRRVLVLPAQIDSIGFITSNAIFDPFSTVTWIDAGMELPKVATLRCDANFRNRSVCEAVAALFVGLIDIQDKYGNAGAAIWEMKQFFENGFSSTYSEDSLIGLLGELVVLNQAADPETLIQYWHSNIDAYFDFSTDNLRLEVKTSKSNLRNHNFSSNQIGSGLDDKTFVSSVILNLVEQGSTLADLVYLISSKVSPDEAAKLLNVVIGTLGVVPNSVKSLKIDLEMTSKTIVNIPAFKIPRPEKNIGVISMHWVANLDHCVIDHVNFQDILSKF
jgi:hypothetical protein